MIYFGMYHKYFYQELNFGVTVDLAGVFHWGKNTEVC
jgi:hypothetical protein